MTLNNPKLEEARKKALLSPNIGKRGKSKKTLRKEELRKMFIEYFGERFMPLLEKLEMAVKKGNMTAILEVLRQLIGSAETKTDITSGGEPITKINYIIPNGGNHPKADT